MERRSEQDRKIMADLAQNQPEVFERFVKQVLG